MEEVETLKEYDHVCIIFGHKEPNIKEFEVNIEYHKHYNNLWSGLPVLGNVYQDRYR